MYEALHTRDDIDYKCKEWKEEEDSSALKTAWKHRYDDSKTTLKRAKKKE